MASVMGPERLRRFAPLGRAREELLLAAFFFVRGILGSRFEGVETIVSHSMQASEGIQASGANSAS